MKSTFASFVAAAAFFVSSVHAAQPLYAQCGGIGWTGETTCVSGATCTALNEYYSQCLAGSGSSTPPTTTTSKPTTTSPTTAPSSTDSLCGATRTKFTYFGVNESGAEFGETKIPGVLGTDYTWPSPTSIDYFTGQGFNVFRIPFLLERLTPPSTGITGAFDSTYLSGLKTIVNYVTNKGAYAIIEPHNYMRFNGAVISDNNAFATLWKNLANEFKSNSHVIFDLMNEPNGIDAGVVYQAMQAAVNSIRTTGATQLILVEGTSWTGAWTWTSSGNAAAFASLSDPNNNVAIEMHQYLDSDGSGTSDQCVSATIGAERVQDATNWLKTNNKKGFLGEIGAGSNDVCVAAVKSALCTLQTAGGVWIGASWWAAGPWWGTYFQSIEPPNGTSISRILPEALKPFM
ncbi:glycoside hydrolase family 5 protein [Macrolepiota fuliginosa MF-IS2]|uniref:cellulase n=1 Tax=Macrolepiota fuliginosa MF-IS2 TaxID=1400762 RepID=A0A9P5XHW4_9AGAR|nr:glycoside hydrolase family 5 protein [Macrolepiota fuliginosa MF-IS2]